MSLAEAQPLVLGFEDLHWAEEPLLDLVEHLADRIDDAPVLIVCLARPELLESRSGWGGGRRRSIAIDLGPLPESETEVLVDALVADAVLPDDVRRALLDKTEGNPLFVEETVRMLAERRGGVSVRIPDTVQALIASRITSFRPTRARSSATVRSSAACSGAVRSQTSTRRSPSTPRSPTSSNGSSSPGSPSRPSRAGPRTGSVTC